VSALEDGRSVGVSSTMWLDDGGLGVFSITGLK
jgi:hypothetical protein